MTEPLRVGFQVEGGIDLVAFPILVRRILSREIDVVKFARRPGGIDAVFNTLKPALWHFWREGAIGAVVAVDNNDRPTHTEAHATSPDGQCRLCRLLSDETWKQLPPRQPLSPLRLAFGVPVRAIEAWLLAAVGEKHPDGVAKAQLKPKLFGTLHPTRDKWETRVGELCESADLGFVRDRSPSFRDFARQVEGWQSSPAT